MQEMPAAFLTRCNILLFINYSVYSLFSILTFTSPLYALNASIPFPSIRPILISEPDWGHSL